MKIEKMTDMKPVQKGVMETAREENAVFKKEKMQTALEKIKEGKGKIFDVKA